MSAKSKSKSKSKKKTPYEALGVPKDADEEAVKRAYRKRAKETHPDAGGASDEFNEVSQAYRTLIDPARRARYDSTGEADDLPTNTAFVLLATLLQQLLGGLLGTGQDPEQVDIIKILQVKLSEERTNVKSGISENSKRLAKIQKVVKRFKVKGKQPNLLAQVAFQPCRVLETELLNLQQRLKDVDEAMKLLKEYEYQFDKPTRQGPSGIWTMESWITSGGGRWA